VPPSIVAHENLHEYPCPAADRAGTAVFRSSTATQPARQLSLVVRPENPRTMPTETSLSGGNLGTVLETYGGKSLKQIVTVGVAIFGCGLTATILIRLFRPDYPGLAAVALGVGVVIALGYGSTNWGAALAKVEVCEGGVRLLRRDGVATELPWNRIRKVTVGQFRKLRACPEHVVIRTADGKDIELPYPFWAAVGAERFGTTIHRFVGDTELEVDFSAREGAVLPGARTMRQEPVYGVWFGAVWPACFLGIFVGMVFALRADGPAWEIWGGRAAVTLFCWVMSFLPAAFSVRELRRRGVWLPPGATRWPWLASAVYAAVMLLISTVVIVGFVVLLELLFGTQGRTNG